MGAEKTLARFLFFLEKNPSEAVPELFNKFFSFKICASNHFLIFHPRATPPHRSGHPPSPAGEPPAVAESLRQLAAALATWSVRPW
jgi:hypothetical protein